MSGTSCGWPLPRDRPNWGHTWTTPGGHHTLAIFSFWMLSELEPWSNSPATTTSEVLQRAREKRGSRWRRVGGEWSAHVRRGTSMCESLRVFVRVLTGVRYGSELEAQNPLCGPACHVFSP